MYIFLQKFWADELTTLFTHCALKHKFNGYGLPSLNYSHDIQNSFSNSISIKN